MGICVYISSLSYKGRWKITILSVNRVWVFKFFNRFYLISCNKSIGLNFIFIELFVLIGNLYR